MLGTEYPPPQELPETPVFQTSTTQPEQVASEVSSSKPESAEPEAVQKTSAESAHQQSGHEYQTGDSQQPVTSADQQSQPRGMCHCFELTSILY